MPRQPGSGSSRLNAHSKYLLVFTRHEMAKFDGIKGQELLDVEEKKNEITLIFKDNRYLFVKIQNGQLVIDSVPE